MPQRQDVDFFGAGPSGLPNDIVEAATKAFSNYDNTGLGLAEISHRSPTANQILAETKTGLTELLNIPPNYEILFLHGGGSGEFSAVVYNLLATWVERRRQVAIASLKAADADAIDEAKLVQKVKDDIATNLRLDYLVTGSWSLKASQEAASLLGPLGGSKCVNVAVDARQAGNASFGSIPPESQWKLTSMQLNSGCPAAFVYYCDNETVDGVEFPSFPKALEDDERIVVADMSSNILSRRVDVAKFGVIFAGAQKNIGITDTTLVIVRKDLLQSLPPPSFMHAVGIWSPPAILNWSVIAKNNSLYNTMPIFSLWVAKQVLQSLQTTHGAARVAGQEKVANEKAKLFYTVIDTYPDIYRPVADKHARSRMSICFRLKDEAADKEFLDAAKAQNFLGLAGHRSVKGVRISNYNVVTLPQAQKLVKFMEDFAKAKTG